MFRSSGGFVAREFMNAVVHVKRKHQISDLLIHEDKTRCIPDKPTSYTRGAHGGVLFLWSQGQTDFVYG